MPEEARLPIDDAGHELWYRRYGHADETLVCLHGGPGGDSRSLWPIGDRLADDSLQVVIYDQLGSGRSDRADDDSAYTVEHYVHELEQVRRRLGLGRMHLYGQSWGGVLALQYALDHPEGVSTLLLSNTLASVAHCVQEMARLRLGIPPHEYAALLRHEAAGTVEDSEYQRIVTRLYARHFRRATPFDEERSVRELVEDVFPTMGEVGPPYYAMWGPHEFLCVGPLLTWDVTDRLGEIDVPTLITCGYYDEVTVPVHRVLADGIRDNEFVIFGNSSHVIMKEKEADAYMGVLRDFIRRNRPRAAAAG